MGSRTNPSSFCEREVLARPFNKWTIVELKNVLKSHDIKYKSNSRKKNLYDELISYSLLQKYSLKCQSTAHHHEKAASTIQRAFRSWMRRRNNQMRGPAFHDRRLCNNDIDPISLTQITDIPDHFFFSYRANDDRIYGFDIRSLKQLLDHHQTRNPFNREQLSEKTQSLIRQTWAYSSDNTCITPDHRAEQTSGRPENLVERAFAIFHDIHLLTGFFVDHCWFTELLRPQLTEMYATLFFWWRTQCIENGQTFNPESRVLFRNFEDICIVRNFNTEKTRSCLISELENLIDCPSHRDDKCTLAMWILTSLIRVSYEAAQNLPFLI